MRQIVLYSFVLVAVTVVLSLGTLGLVYLIAALSLGGGFIWLAVGLARRTTPPCRTPLPLSLYLALIFVFAAIDVVA